MAFSKISSAVLALSAAFGANALPSTKRSSYAVKERHPVPRSWTASGPAPKSEMITLQIGLKQQNEGEIERHLVEISDPEHARYGEHLSAAEVHDLVTPSDETVELVHEWLREHGLSTFSMGPAKDWVMVHVPISKAEELLQTSYQTFTHADGSTLSRAPEWSLPAHLHEHVDVVQPTNSFFRPAPQAKSWGPLTSGASYPISWWEHTGKHLYGPPVSRTM